MYDRIRNWELWRSCLTSRRKNSSRELSFGAGGELRFSGFEWAFGPENYPQSIRDRIISQGGSRGKNLTFHNNQIEILSLDPMGSARTTLADNNKSPRGATYHTSLPHSSPVASSLKMSLSLEPLTDVAALTELGVASFARLKRAVSQQKWEQQQQPPDPFPLTRVPFLEMV
jgi:hypothetical protein